MTIELTDAEYEALDDKVTAALKDIQWPEEFTLKDKNDVVFEAICNLEQKEQLTKAREIADKLLTLAVGPKLLITLDEMMKIRGWSDAFEKCVSGLKKKQAAS